MVRGFTLFQLLAALTVISIAAAVAIPALLAARIRANEDAAVETLRFIAEAQTRFLADGKVDLDHDGRPEFGFLKEMAGATGVRAAADGSKVGAPVSPAPLSSGFGVLDEGGEFVRGGYRFRVFLPGAGGVGVGEPRALRFDADVDAKLAATTWCCYAWPTRHGTTGRRTFFVNQIGRVVATDCDEYTGAGPFTSRDCGAAFRGAGALSSMTGEVAAGTRGRDGNAWRSVP